VIFPPQDSHIVRNIPDPRLPSSAAGRQGWSCTGAAGCRRRRWWSSPVHDHRIIGFASAFGRIRMSAAVGGAARTIRAG